MYKLPRKRKNIENNNNDLNKNSPPRKKRKVNNFNLIKNVLEILISFNFMNQTV